MPTVTSDTKTAVGWTAGLILTAVAAVAWLVVHQEQAIGALSRDQHEALVAVVRGQERIDDRQDETLREISKNLKDATEGVVRLGASVDRIDKQGTNAMRGADVDLFQKLLGERPKK